MKIWMWLRMTATMWMRMGDDDDDDDEDENDYEDEDVKPPWGVQQLLPNAFRFETPRAVPTRLIDLCKYDYHMDDDVENYDDKDNDDDNV